MKIVNEVYTMKAATQLLGTTHLCGLVPCDISEIEVPHVYQLIALRKDADDDDDKIVDKLYATFITDVEFEVTDDEDEMNTFCEDLVFECVDAERDRLCYTIRRLS